MEQVVLDTSVVAKLFLEEEGSEMALKIKDDHVSNKIEILLPSLTRYELINILKYKKFDKEEIKEALEVIRDYGFLMIEPTDSITNKIAEICVDYDISAYDATYVALAQHVTSTLYTADKKLIKSVKLPFVKHIKDFK